MSLKGSRIFPNPDYLQAIVEYHLDHYDPTSAAEMFNVGYVLGVAHSSHLLAAEAYKTIEADVLDAVLATYTREVAKAVLYAFGSKGWHAAPALERFYAEGVIDRGKEADAANV